jgi:hypothetical protein
MNRTGSLVLATLVSLTAATAASAQLPGIPYGPVTTGLGLTVAADYGRPDIDGAKAYGLTAGLGFSRFGISASVGALDNGFDSEMSVGARLGMKLFGGGLNPITVGAQLGVASIKSVVATPTPDTVRINMIMPGAFVRLSPPLFPLKPWGQVYYRTGNDLSDEAKEVRFVVGADFNLLLGLGVHAGYDFGSSDNGNTWGVGAHFTFRVPGLGVPGVPGM